MEGFPVGRKGFQQGSLCPAIACFHRVGEEGPRDTLLH